MVQDPELIKRIFVTNFNSFSDRVLTAFRHDPLGYFNLFSIKGDLWKKIRQKLTPFFTSGKLKMMFYLLDMSANEMITSVDKKLNKITAKIDIKNLFFLCTTDIIARCAFGLEANAQENPDGEFTKAAEMTFKLTSKRKFELPSFFFFPWLADKLRFKSFSSFTSDFILKTVPEVMEIRKKSGIQRHDLIDMFIELNDTNEFESIDVLCAQAAAFFSAGHETTSTALTMSLYEVSLNRIIHDRLRDEIKTKMNETNGKITYELLMTQTELPYLHQVVMEALRKYPTIPFLERSCVNPDGFSLEPHSNFKIPFNMPIHVSNFGLMRNEKFFPNPMKFDPERFAEMSTSVFLPFGIGPRMCIGERFSLMAVKLLLVKVLMNYEVMPTPGTPKEIEMVENSITIQSKQKIILNFSRDK